MTAHSVASIARQHRVASRPRSNIHIVQNMIRTLHPTQRAIYRKIVSYMDTHGGLAPTRHEIAMGLGIAEGAYIRYHLLKLEKAGLIILAPRVRRGIRLPEEAPRERETEPNPYDYFISHWQGA